GGGGGMVEAGEAVGGGAEEVSRLVGRQVPDDEGVVLVAAGSQVAAVGRESQADHRPLVPLEPVQRLPGGHVPDPDRVVPAAGDEDPAVRGARQAGNRPAA